MKENIGKVLKKVNLNKAFEILYLVFYALILISVFKRTTKFTFVIPSWFNDLIHGGFPVFIIFKMLASDKWKKKDIAIAILLAGSLYASNVINGWSYRDKEAFILETVFLIIGAKGIDSEKMVKVFFLVTAAFLAFSITRSLSGNIQNLIFFQKAHGYKPRISFGIIYPTDFAAHVFFTLAAYLWIRGRNAGIMEALVLMASGAFCYIFCDARNTVICIALLTIGVLVLKVYYFRLKKKGIKEDFTDIEISKAESDDGNKADKKPGKKSGGFRRFVGHVFCNVNAIIAFVMIILAYNFDRRISIFYYANKLLNGRLKYSHFATLDYSLKPFGQYVKMVGNGGTVLPKKDYYFLDVSYINIMFRFGIVVLLAVLVTLSIISYRQMRRKNWLRLWVLVVCAVAFTFEHHLMELAYNPFLIIVLAECFDRDKDGIKDQSTDQSTDKTVEGTEQ